MLEHSVLTGFTARPAAVPGQRTLFPKHLGLWAHLLIYHLTSNIMHVSMNQKWMLCFYSLTHVKDGLLGEDEGGDVLELLEPRQDLAHRLRKGLLFHGTDAHHDL